MYRGSCAHDLILHFLQNLPHTREKFLKRMDKLTDGLEAYQETRLYKPKDPQTEPREKLLEAIRSNRKAVAVIRNHISRLESSRPDLIGSPYHRQLTDSMDEVMAETETYEQILESDLDDAEYAKQLQAEYDSKQRQAVLPKHTEISLPKTNTKYAYIVGASACFDPTLRPDRTLREQFRAASPIRWEPVREAGNRFWKHIQPYLGLFATYSGTVSEMYVAFKEMCMVFAFRLANPSETISASIEVTLRNVAVQYSKILQSQTPTEELATRIEVHCEHAPMGESIPFGKLEYQTSENPTSPKRAVYAQLWCGGPRLMFSV